MRTLFFLVLVACVGSGAYATEPTAAGVEPPLFSVDFDRTGPLTLEELRISFNARMREQMDDPEMQCVLGEVERLAAKAGDPATLDPATVEFLSEEHWPQLEERYRRVILAQTVVTRAFFNCN